MSTYSRLSFTVPRGEEELFSIEMFAGGASGIELEEDAGARRWIVYAADPLPPGLDHEPASWRERGICRLGVERCQERDWLAEHRAAVRPIRIGRRFLVDPGEPRPGLEPAGRKLLRVPARRAFGTGSHESTRLVMEWLEEIRLERLAVLDLGCGSGILAMAARVLGASEVVALDVDPVACCVAFETLRLNGLDAALVAGRIDCLANEERFDLVLANILPDSWLDEVEPVVARLVPGGRLLVSGVPREGTRDVARRLESTGLRIHETRHHHAWTAMLAARTAS